MGDLRLKSDGAWIPVKIDNFEVKEVGKLKVKIPIVEEQKKWLKLFGRQKDLRRLALLES